jgi:very-short-patch-repair endonuclease
MRTSTKSPTFPTKNFYTKILDARLGGEWWAEWYFHPTRKWRFDYALPELKIAIEVDGGLFNSYRGKHAGRHSGGIGQLNDMEKMNAAAELGWLVFHYTPDDFLNHTQQLENAIKFKKNLEK